MKITKKEIEILKIIIGTELKMIEFTKGFKRSKTVHETNLEKILEKLGTVVTQKITVKEGKT